MTKVDGVGSLMGAINRYQQSFWCGLVEQSTDGYW
jgi:hypothetical protein